MCTKQFVFFFNIIFIELELTTSTPVSSKMPGKADWHLWDTWDLKGQNLESMVIDSKDLDSAKYHSSYEAGQFFLTVKAWP